MSSVMRANMRAGGLHDLLCRDVVVRRSRSTAALSPRLPQRLSRGRSCNVASDGLNPSGDLRAQSSSMSDNGRDLGDTSALPENFCIIESRSEVMDFAGMQLDEIRKNIDSRRNKIFLLMEEVRRLRIQQRLKLADAKTQSGDDDEEQEYLSALPFLPHLSDKSLKTYFALYGAAVALIILFGGLVAPILEVRLGLGGTTYKEFIETMRLPEQLAEVDPIVASFCGGAVGVVSGLLVVEYNNIQNQVKDRCTYCEGTGYLTCGNCGGSGTDARAACSCNQCASTGKVMCTACLCTGKKMATEHDPRIDPFD